MRSEDARADLPSRHTPGESAVDDRQLTGVADRPSVGGAAKLRELVVAPLVRECADFVDLTLA